LADQPHDDTPPICNYEDSTYRTDFWEGQGREYEDLAERWALRRLLPPAGRRLLDIGAGFGRLAGLYGGYDQVILLDYSRSQLAYARQNLGDERFIYVAADVYHLHPATSAVDTTVMVRVLHHLADVPAAFAQLARVTRPQGNLVLEFANKRHHSRTCSVTCSAGAPTPTTPPRSSSPAALRLPPGLGAGPPERGRTAPVARRSVSLFRAGPLKRALPARWLAAADGLLQRPTAALRPGPQRLRPRRVYPPRTGWPGAGGGPVPLPHLRPRAPAPAEGGPRLPPVSRPWAPRGWQLPLPVRPHLSEETSKANMAAPGRPRRVVAHRRRETCF
jgi:SAM-dependent methyltransferase